jgi:hypothetical protein
MMLRTWPSRRARLGQALQLLASVGADHQGLLDAADLWLDEPDGPFLLLTAELERHIATQNGLDIEPRDVYARALAHDLSVQIGNLVGQELVEQPAASLAAAEWARDLAQVLPHVAMPGLAGLHLAELCRRIAHESRPNLGPPWAGAIVKALAERQVAVSAVEPVWLDFSLVESHARARHTTATALAFRGRLADETDDERVALITSACRAHLRIGAQDFTASAARARNIDPLWMALGRYLAGRSTDDDHAFLARVAASAEHTDPRLQAGLRYYVRGDLVTDDGELTLDAICHELGRPALGLLAPPRHDRRAPTLP